MGFCTVWASAASTTSRGVFVRSAAQSRKLDRKPMRHGGEAEFLDQFRERRIGEWLPAQTAEHEAGAVAPSLCVVQDRERPPRERDAVIPVHLQIKLNYLNLMDYTASDSI